MLEPLDDLAAIAAQETPEDTSVTNGSSIALLIEHRGTSVVLGADVSGSVLSAGLAGVSAARGGERLAVDAVKLPHHGSKNNVTEAPGRRRDGAALNAPPGATLWFNYSNPRNRRWADPELRGQYGYRTRFPVTSSGGIMLELST